MIKLWVKGSNDIYGLYAIFETEEEAVAVAEELEDEYGRECFIEDYWDENI